MTVLRDRPNVRLILDTSAVLQFGRSEHVGEPIVSLGEEKVFARFGVSVLALAVAWERAGDKEGRDLIVSLTTHPRFVALPVLSEHALRVGDLGGPESPLAVWSYLGSPDRAHSVLQALDFECQILTAEPDRYDLAGLTIPIPGEGDSWPDAGLHWPA
jgi:hypothetical protein